MTSSLHVGGGELNIVGRGIDWQRGSVSSVDGNLHEAAACGGRKGDLHCGIVQRHTIGGGTADQDLGGLHEAGALHDERLAWPGRHIVGNGVAGKMEEHGADNAVAQFGAQRQAGRRG